MPFVVRRRPAGFAFFWPALPRAGGCHARGSEGATTGFSGPIPCALAGEGGTGGRRGFLGGGATFLGATPWRVPCSLMGWSGG